MSWLLVATALAAPWDGHYVYEASYGKSAGGSYIAEQYDITINSAKPSGCLISIAGFQRDEKIVCTVREQGNKATLLFSSATGSQRIGSYSVGSPLLALESRPKERIRTTWFRLKAMDDKAKKPGLYFAKVKSGGS